MSGSTTLNYKHPRRESPAVYGYYRDWKELGDKRSVHLLYETYQRRIRAGETNVPFVSERTLSHACTRHQWVLRLRLEEEDDEREQRKNTARRRAAIWDRGLAADFERVQSLVVQANRLLAVLQAINIARTDPDNPDKFLKPMREDLDMFIVSLKAYREVLADIAKEKGERVTRIDVRTETIDWAREYARKRGADEEEAVRIAEDILASATGGN